MAVKYHDIPGKNVYIVEFDAKCKLVPIVRKDADLNGNEELFSDTIKRAQAFGKFEVCTNACWFDVTSLGKSDALLGDDPVSANETINQGIALMGTGERYGNSSPLMMYAAQSNNLSWEFGSGDVPTSGFYTGIGGMCPLIINGLKYGTGNKYSKKIDEAIIFGKPREQDVPFLTQRNNNKYAALEKAAAAMPGMGKVGFGVTSKGKCYVAVQSHYNPGMSFNDFRGIFLAFNCINAVAGDGSDSVFMYRDNVFVVESAHNKVELMTIGLGFKDIS
ncbi:hypothetical protein [Buttiauxella noackiae]|uniref:hypothetical protein n=1 Tax=Buttiauxella noackiae TaxID=82992 RepID=UPI00068D62E3|nr:hypothetical protein [Buttiauxella noackiae]